LFDTLYKKGNTNNQADKKNSFLLLQICSRFDFISFFYLSHFERDLMKNTFTLDNPSH